MDKGLWNRLLKGMKGDELGILSSLIHGEKIRRAEKRVSEGRFVELSDEEKEMINSNQLKEAALTYKRRTGCHMYLATKVVDHYGSTYDDQGFVPESEDYASVEISKE